MTKFNRRELFQLTGAAGITAAAGMTSSASAKETKMVYPWEKMAVNIEAWYTDVPFMERAKKAADAGFKAIEFWGTDGDGRDMKQLAADCKALDLKIVQFTGWGHVTLAETSRHPEMVETIKRSCEIAHVLDAPMFTIVGHNDVEGMSQAQKIANLTSAMELAVPIMEDAGVIGILEPFNPVDHLGYFLNGAADALAICRDVDSKALKLNWDLYHMQLSDGNLVDFMKKGIDQIAYIQVADVPGRNQPGTGELNYTYIFDQLWKMGYHGYVGLECWPTGGDNDKAKKDLINVLSA